MKKSIFVSFIICAWLAPMCTMGYKSPQGNPVPRWGTSSCESIPDPGIPTVEFSPTSSLLEVSWCFSAVCFTVIVIAFVATPYIHCLNCSVSADLLLLLMIPFNSCQINSHRFIEPSESGVGAAVPCPSLWWLTQQFSPIWLLWLVHCLFWSCPIVFASFCWLGTTPSCMHYHPNEFWPVVVLLAVPTEAFGISGWFRACLCWIWLLGGWILLAVALVLLFHLLVYLGSFCVILFLWFWVQGGHSFEPIYWPFVGGLVGTVSNLLLDTGLLQFFLLSWAPLKGKINLFLQCYH